MRSYKKWLLILLPCVLAVGVIGAIWLKASAEDKPQLTIQIGHSNEVRAVAFSNDGKLALTGSEDRTAILWDVTTGKVLRRFVGHAAGINTVAFSPDNKFVLTGSGQTQTQGDLSSEAIGDDASVRVWDTSTGKEAFRLTENGLFNITSAVFSPSGDYILAAGARELGSDSNQAIRPEYEHIAFLWSAKTGSLIHELKHHSGKLIRKGFVAISPDSRMALVGFNILFDNNYGAQLWDIQKWEKIRQLNEGEFASFSSDGQAFITDRSNFFNSQTGEQIKLISPLRLPLEKTTFSPNVQFAVGYNSHGHLEAWDIATRKQVLAINKEAQHLEDFDSPTSNVAFSPDSKFVLVGLMDGNSRIWNLIQKRVEVTLQGMVVSYKGKFLPNSQFVATGNYLWDVTSGKQLERTPKEFEQYAQKSRMIFSSDARVGFIWRDSTKETFGITGGYRDGTLVDFQTGTTKRIFDSDSQGELAPLFSPDGQLLVSGDVMRKIALWKVSSGELVRTFGPEEYDIDSGNGFDNYAAAFSPDGHYILSETQVAAAKLKSTNSKSSYPDDSLVNVPCLFSVDTGQIVRLFIPNNISEHGSGVAAAAFSLDGQYVLSGTRGGRLEGVRVSGEATLWDVKTGKEIRRFEGLSEDVTAVAFSPDGRFILTGGGDRFVILWDATTGKMIRKLESFFSNGLSVNFSPDSRFILTGSHDGALAIWEVAIGRELCRLISFENGDWVVIAPDGRFDTNNLDNISGLHWVTSDEPLRPLPLEIFMRQYYEPRLLARALAGEQFKPLPKISELNRTQPAVKIVDISPDAAGTTQVTVEVANAKSEGQRSFFGSRLESGVFDVRLFRNGQLVGYAPENDGEVKLNAEGKATLKFSNIKLPRTGVEQVEFSAYAFNADRVKSATDRKTYQLTPKPAPVKGRVYLIRLGVNAAEREGLQLRYAANDARQANDLAARLAARGEYQEVVSLPLISDYTVTLADGRTLAAHDATSEEVRAGRKSVTENTATKAHLRAVLDVLAGRQGDAALLKQIPNADKLRAARPEDLVLISASSHGYTDSDGIFYLVPSDSGTADLKSPEFRRRCVSSDELSRWLRDVDAGELVLIVDACHSAAAIEGTDFKPGPMGSRGLGQLSYDKGMRILTATQADNVALEKGGLGLLMRALLVDGLNAWQADYKPRDRSILLTEWLTFGVERVPRLYEEMRDGRMRGTFDPRELAEGKTQQPALFDFARRRREVVLAWQP